MIVGNGLIAKRFKKYLHDKECVVFASGVSNSKNTNLAEYNREFELLQKVYNENKDKILIYFSTCSINDSAENKSQYVAHKLNIENYIQENVETFFIFRVSNLVGHSSNPNTILNFIANNIKQQIHFDLWAYATRNLIDVDDFFVIANHIIQNKLFQNHIINIANPINNSVLEIVSTAEMHFAQKADYTLVEKGGSFNIDISKTSPYFEQLNVNFYKDYLKNLLNKYY